ncbi:hypothetical protein H2200_002446 [Cladophialophora chaetospira]|uniref:Uncharacterized protein n=1 Tax=Cladophialophora chaetospira TaxID=386627 RepID=A0AA38XIW2_9EURO|nr:hypothetical protein H2200_002446 [Cladophialophora chaetospira]
MPSESKVYIVGVGSSASSRDSSSATGATKSLVSAAVKALLDAGVTCEDVSRGVISSGSDSSNSGSEFFKALGRDDLSVDNVKRGSEFDSVLQWIRVKGAQSVLSVALEKSTAVAFVLASENFLHSHPYLKDSAALIRELDGSQSATEGSEKSQLHDICQMVWRLRGWSDSNDAAGKKEQLSYQGASNKSFQLSRADSRATPEWNDVEHKQDGKHRLGYNPANETREVSQEDFEAVKATGRKDNKAGDQIQFKRKGGDRAALSKL